MAAIVFVFVREGTPRQMKYYGRIGTIKTQRMQPILGETTGGIQQTVWLTLQKQSRALRNIYLIISN